MLCSFITTKRSVQIVNPLTNLCMPFLETRIIDPVLTVGLFFFLIFVAHLIMIGSRRGSIKLRKTRWAAQN